MSELLGIRAFHRSQRIRIGQKQIQPNITTFVNLTNPVVRRDIQKHSAIGAFLTVTPLTTTADAGYVVQGGKVTQSTAASLVVNVASGVVKINGTNVSFAATTKTVTTADTTNPRFDIITVNASGAVTLTAGTAAPAPVIPAVPANSTTLAVITVPASDTTITNDQISDVR